MAEDPRASDVLWAPYPDRMSLAVLDLSTLEPADLRALRLGAQVMSHKAALEQRPRVGVVFAALSAGVEAELARRDQACPEGTGSVILPFAEREDRLVEAGEDRRLLGEYLDLLCANAGLSAAVRGAYDVIRDQLAEPGDSSPQGSINQS